MEKNNKTFNILVAEDDSDDRQMIKEAFEENKLTGTIQFVDDGEDLVNFLKQKGTYGNNPVLPAPDLIILDLNMPKKDGRDALLEIKSDPYLKSIPIIILTTSKVKEDILNTYSLGVNCFISKPSSYFELIEITDSIINFWFEIAQLPNRVN